MNTAYSNPFTVAEADASARAAFIRNTYLHLALAIVAFVALETYWLSSEVGASLYRALTSVSWLVVLGAFMVVSWIADRWAQSDTSKGMQYLGLGLFVVAESIIFLPLLAVAASAGGGDVIPKAAVTTGFLFAGITITALVSQKDFSFLRGFLMMGGFVALGIIVVGTVAGFSLGTWFAGAMVLFAGGSILYTTSQMVHHYRTDQYVAASLGLFAGVALLFWYIVQIFMARD